MKKILKVVATTLLSATMVLSNYSFIHAADQRESVAANMSDSELVEMLFHNSYNVFADLRNDIGVYRDSVLLEPGANYHPSSVAATGIGLMSLTIADAKKWDTTTLSKARTTVSTMLGARPSFQPDRTANGFYRHFINMETGAQEWNSEYSTIDTAIFVAGALFASNYYNDPELSRLTAELYHSIDFNAAIANPETGSIYLTLHENGSGNEQTLTLPYNEYLIVSWLAYNQNIDKPTSKSVQHWNKHYRTPDNLLKKTYSGLPLLTDHPDHYLSSFTVLFPYYLVNMFSQSAAYAPYISNAYRADKLWSANTGQTQSFEWGNGAGAAIEGYHADAINNNNFITVSPHIIAGFLPVNPSGLQDIINLYRNGKGIYTLQSDATKEILWRYSVLQPEWRANSIQGIDYSTFLFGLATADSSLGMNFFQAHNRFFKTVHFNANSVGVTSPAQQQVINGATVRQPQLYRPGYAVASWNTKADGSGQTWDFSQPYQQSGDITLYAQWLPEVHFAVGTPMTEAMFLAAANLTPTAGTTITTTFYDVVDPYTVGQYFVDVQITRLSGTEHLTVMVNVKELV